jgi:hypothetical protein
MLQLGRIIAKAIGAGSLGALSPDLGSALASHPKNAEEIVRLLFAEARKKRANANQINAFCLMLGRALETARWRIENDSASANDLIERVRETVVKEAVEKDSIRMLFAIARCFADAKVELGAKLNRLIEVKVSSNISLPANVNFQQMLQQLEKTLEFMAGELDHDPFLIHDQIVTMLDTFPIEPRIEIISMMVLSPTPSIRDAAAGFILDPKVTISNATAGFLATAMTSGMVSGATICRLMIMRNWTNEDTRFAIDAIIRASRQKEITLPSRPSVQINGVLASACDGAGAQSFFLKLRDKKKFSIASLLLKHGFGLRDAWVREGLTGAEKEMFLAEIEHELINFDGSLEIIRTAIEHGLAITIAKGEVIPFELVHFVEAAALGSVMPIEHSPERLLDQLITEASLAKVDGLEISNALARSKKWDKCFPWLELWFEDSEAAVRAVGNGAKKKDKVENVIRDVLTSRRRYWGELLIWTTFGASHDDRVKETADLILVARELLTTRPLTEIPLAALIAKTTVECLQQRRV